MGEEEKNYIIRQADMYISGKSLREIAEIIGKSHITVRNNLTKKLRYADAIKYEIVMEKCSGRSGTGERSGGGGQEAVFFPGRSLFI